MAEEDKPKGEEEKKLAEKPKTGEKPKTVDKAEAKPKDKEARPEKKPEEKKPEEKKPEAKPRSEASEKTAAGRDSRDSSRGGRPRERRFPPRDDEEVKVWKPKTKLGWKVHNGEITSMHEVMQQSSPIKEVEIIDKLLPELQEEILDVGRVQRVTDSGRRMRFRIVAAVGNRDGYFGVGESKGKEAGPTIRKSIERAKLNIKEVKRGCGSWECGCGNPHTVPFLVSGKEGSVNVTLRPAPRGVGIVSGELAKTILSLAGIKDVWVSTKGHTRTGINFARAVINALENTNYVKIKEGDNECLNIVAGQSKQPEPVVEEVQS
ncbi:MAG: 30S ribosomal protein S5 [Candidatus Altiarchaeales archaeon]|nr:30S ribosomal protein S5 [Candidatus Altiarchaeales archaeon]MBD3415796.1 30S ribosomal protein S5 [Candidatus Altiarchaeales archaeon]